MMEEMTIRFLEDTLFDSLAHFYSYFSYSFNTEKRQNEEMNSTLHSVKDHLCEGFSLVGLDYVTHTICRAIDIDNYRTKRSLFEGLYCFILQIYQDLGSVNAKRSEYFRKKLRSEWPNISRKAKHYARNHVKHIYQKTQLGA